MKEYQKKVSEVKEIVKIADEEKLTELASTGLLNLSTEPGFEVLRQMLEADVTELVGEKGKHNPNRKAYRHGSGQTKVVSGGQKRPILKPRVRGRDGTEHTLPTLALFQDDTSLTQMVLTKLLCGVSTRKYSRTSEHEPKESASVSKSGVSRRFIKGMKEAPAEFFKRNIDNGYPVIMIDGMNIGKMTVIAAMGITKGGEKRMLGVTEGASGNNTVVKTLLADLIERGLNPKLPRLFVLDGSKALVKGVNDTYGKYAAIQRCQVHKKRNVLSHLPKSGQSGIGLAISKAYLETDYEKAKKELLLITQNLEYHYPKAAGSLLEGLDETLTVHRLKLPGLLRQTLSSANAMESANSACTGVIRRVKNRQDAEMILRHIAAGFMEAESGFRRVRGYRQLPVLTNGLFDVLELSLPNSSSDSA